MTRHDSDTCDVCFCKSNTLDAFCSAVASGQSGGRSDDAVNGACDCDLWM